MNTRRLRILRAGTASTVATTLAAASHTVAGGAAPHPLLVAAMASFLVPVAAVVVGIRPSRLRVATTVLLSQTLFHVAFQVLGAPTGSPGVIGHEHHVDLSVLGAETPVAAPDPLMLVGHLVAAALTTAALCHGESMVRDVAGWVRAHLRRAITPFRSAHDGPVLIVASEPSLIDSRCSSSVSLRGPPVLA